MPTFRPPLGAETDILLDSTPGRRYFLLTFLAALDHVDDNSVLQLWTDIPSLTIHGTREVPAGEWHSIPFSTLPKVYNHPSSSEEAKGVIAIPCLQAAPIASTFTHIATIAILAQPGQFEYTLRIEHAEGQYQWLGSGSSNGRIKIIPTVAGTVAEAGVDIQAWPFNDAGKSGTWKEASAKVNTNGSHQSGMIQLGSTNHSLTILNRFVQPDEIPFYRPSKDFNLKPRIPTPIAISFSPQPLKLKNAQNTSTWYFDDESTFIRDAISAALRQDKSIPFRLLDGSDNEMAVLAAKTPVSAIGQSSIKLHAFARTLTQKKLVIDIPSTLDNSAPTLLDVSGSLNMIDINEGETTRNQYFTVLSGFSSAEITFTEFLGLRGNGSEDVIYVCCPSADQVEIGEMDIGNYIERRNSEEYKAALFAANAELDWLEGTEDQRSEADLALDEETGVNRSVAGVDSNDGEDTGHTGEDAESNGVNHALLAKADTRPWILRLIGLFITRIWSLVTFPFRRAVENREEDTAAEQTAGDDARGGTDEQSDIVDETTPLLKTPGLSRSASSTVDSPLASPESVLTIRPVADNNTPYQEIGHKAPTLPRTESDNYIHPPVHLSDPTKVRSYTLFTFHKNPPFSFYIPATVCKWEEKIKFMVKADLNLMFREVKPVVGKTEGGVVELILGEELSVDDTRWEVEVERI